MTVQADFFRFITTGEFGPFKVGTEWSAVVDALGEPPLYGAPKGEGRPAFARYGILDFTIEGGRISVISLHVHWSGLELPSAVAMRNFEDPQMRIHEVQLLFDDAGAIWKRYEPMCDDDVDYYHNPLGVHLVFRDDSLCVVASAAIPLG
jgi:hypothetical protein